VVTTATEEFLSPEEVGERIGVSVYTVRRWVKTGQLRAFKPGKEYRIQKSDLEEFLRAREVRPKAPRRSPSEPSFNDVLEEERREAEREKLPGWTRAAVEDQEFVRRFEEAKRSAAEADRLAAEEHDTEEEARRRVRDLKASKAPAAELQRARRDLQQTKARLHAAMFLAVDVWRGVDVSDKAAVDYAAELAASWRGLRSGDLFADAEIAETAAGEHEAG
jgi:excisionase family DNA binding protein